MATLEEDQVHAPVSVVIPTRGRPALLERAIDSVRRQTLAPEELIVVVDGPDDQTVELLASIDLPQLKAIALDESRGAAAARNVGIRASTCRWVALLDDDDEWLPSKLERQMTLADEGHSQLLATGVEWRGPSWSEVFPKRAPRSAERVGDYLFVRSLAGEGMLCTPTIMVRRDLATRVPFDETMALHEDYDWFLRLEEEGAALSVVVEPLVIVHAESERATLAPERDWRVSLSWVRSERERLSPEAYAGFVLTEVARRGMQQRSMRTALTLLREASRGRPRTRDLARFLLMVLVSPRQLAALRRRLAGRGS